MLRYVRIKNFVHFKEEQNVAFEEGSHFFIGPNNSGKTSVFEAIRRCLSISMNTSLSSSHVPGEESVVVCIYHGIQDNYLSSDAPSYFVQNTEDETYKTLEGKLLTAIICLVPNKPDQHNQPPDDVLVYVKIAIYFGPERCRFGMEFIKQNRHMHLVNERIKFLFTKDWYALLVDMMETNKTDFQLNKFVEQVLKIHEGIEEERRTFASKDILQDKESPCNKILRDYLDEHVVFTFPMRSIGSLQWSFSERVGRVAERTHNAQKCAEIVSWYITNICEKNERKNDDVQKKEQLYFDRITNNSGFEFTKVNGGDLRVSTTSDREQMPTASGDHPEEIPILKVPEGILEAKSCSILLAVDSFTTVGLEDPERGMHPQMVERLRDLVLWEIKNKVVLVTSHHPSFLAPWAISRICFFRYNDQENTFRIISGKRITEPLIISAEDKQDTTVNEVESKRVERTETNKIPHTLRIITGYRFSSIFFAERVMLVEGETEELFMNTMRILLMENDKYVKTLASNTELDEIVTTVTSNTKPDKSVTTVASNRKTNELEKFRRFMASLQIIHLAGEGNKEKFENLCKNLKIERYFLLDKDAIKPKENERLLFVQKFNLSYSQDEVQEHVEVLEKEGIFVWRHGNIENVFCQFINTHDKTHQQKPPCTLNHEDMAQCLKNNKVNVYSDGKSPTKIKTIKGKLLADKSLTDENVRELVKIVLDVSAVEKDSEFRRLVNFLYTMAWQRNGLRFNRKLST